MLINIMRTLRKRMREVPGDLNIPNIYFEETRRTNGSPYLMPLVALKTNPCRWLVSGGGCSMCGYQLAASLSKKPTKENIINQTKYVIKKIPSHIYPFLTFNSAGSFLDSTEMNDDLRPLILGMLKRAGYQEFNFESRPEFLLDKKKLSQLKDYFDIISVGIGLESSDDFIRNECLNKGTKLEIYLKAIKILKEVGIGYDAYILLGKPFLTPREDIEDAVKSIDFAFHHGFENIILMLSNIQPFTLIYLLWKKRKFSPPMLWSAIEVIKKLSEKYRSNVYIKGFNRAVPVPLEFSSNCNKCNNRVVESLIHWNLTGDFGHIERIPKCDCIKIWNKKMQKTDIKLAERIKNTKSYVEKILNIK